MRDDYLSFWREESWNYFRRNYEGRNLREIPLSPYLENLFHGFPLRIEGGSILDIGCGAANNLFHLKRMLGARRGVGVEPSPRTVNALIEQFPELEFYEQNSVELPFYASEFDLVALRSVLHWVERDYLLHTMGEAIRVTSKYLVVSDFAPLHPYSSVYHHEPRYRTFKMSYRPLIEATGSMQCVASFRSDIGDEWNAVETLLFRKLPLDEAFPLRREEDFKR